MADQSETQAIKQALEAATAAANTAQQAAEQASQAVQQAARASGAESTRQVIDATRTAGSQEIGAEREFETGKDEMHAETIGDLINNWISNRKRTYDEYQDVGLGAARMSLRIGERIATDSLDHAARLRVIAERQLNNAATHDVDLNRQHLAHRDIATDRTWNVDEVSNLTAKTGVQQDAIAAAVAAAVVAALAEAGE